MYIYIYIYIYIYVYTFICICMCISLHTYTEQSKIKRGAESERELYIELPDEAKTPEDGDVVGRLNRMMYGFRDASNGWARDWQALLKGNGYKVGKANAALFYNKELKSRGGVHGEDFYVLGPRKSIDEMNRVLGSKYSLRESYRLGFGPEA